MVDASFPGGFTVLMAVYGKDCPNLFRRSVESVFANTLQPSCVLLIVDGPVPLSIDQEINSLQHKFALTVHRISSNIGLAGSLNKGLELVETEWVLRADADDYNLPNRFQVMAETLATKNGALDLFGSAIIEVDSNDREIAVRRTVNDKAAIRRFARTRNPFNHMTVAMRAEMVRSVGGYPNIALKEDYALWASLLRVDARVANISDVLVRATTGSSFYARRGGLDYAKSEWALQRHLVLSGLKNYPSAIVDGSIRATAFILPSWLKSALYRNFLRV